MSVDVGVLGIIIKRRMGSQLGVVLAAILLVSLPEFGRAFAEFRMLIFCAVMVVVMVWRPLFFFQAEDGIRDGRVTRVQTCALPISTHGNAIALSAANTRPDRKRLSDKRG